jgi:hypothetical protein
MPPIAGAGPREGLARGGPERHAARRVVLDDDAGGPVELLHRGERRLEVEQVVVAELLALQDPGEGDGRLGRLAPGPVEGAGLVRVLAVAEVARLLVDGGERGGEVGGGGPGRLARGEPLGDGGVVGGGVAEGLLHEPEAGRLGEGAARLELLRDRVVVGRVHHHADVGRVLGGAPHHGRPADVDLLHALGEGLPGLDRLAERVEVHHHEVDRRDVARLHVRLVGGEAAAVEDAAVHAGVERLHPAAQDLRRLRVVADGDDRHARVRERALRAAGGEQLHAERGEPPGEGDEAGLVRDRDEGAADHGKHLREGVPF